VLRASAAACGVPLEPGSTMVAVSGVVVGGFGRRADVLKLPA